MNHLCEFILRRGEFKGLECAKPALWSFEGKHYCKFHCDALSQKVKLMGGQQKDEY